MGKFAENLNLGKRGLPPAREEWKTSRLTSKIALDKQSNLQNWYTSLFSWRVWSKESRKWAFPDLSMLLFTW